MQARGAGTIVQISSNSSFQPVPRMAVYAATKAFDPSERDEWLAKVHTREVDEALFMWVVHDVAPRALSPKVKGFVQARNWFQSLTPVYMAK